MFNTNYDIVIIGGGITGLFLAYNLCETNLNILLLEKEKTLGGRIKTINKGNVIYEAGAARFSEKHTKVLSLINDLDLDKKVRLLPKKITNKLREYNTDNKLNIQYLFNILKSKYKSYGREYLKNITLFQLFIEIFDFETAEYVKDAFGYDAEFLYLNADAALLMYKDDLFSINDYFVLEGGLIQLITKMEKMLKLKENVTILKNNILNNIYNDKIVTSIDTYYYKNLILTIPYYNLKKLDEFKDFKLLDTVKPIQLLRVYAKYPVSGGVWFKNINRTTSNNYIRHIIPIDQEKGLIMISYTDTYMSELWNNIYLNGEKELIKALHKEIKKLFNIEPPEPEKIYVHNWEAGVHLWKIGFNIEDIYPKIMKPDNNKNIFICGETYSKKQCWIEGSLETCYDLLKMLELPGVQIRIETSTTEINEETINKDNGKIKEYTIKDVLKHDDWIVFEINGNKNIYDISKWIPHHPGGSAILRGVKANKYYLNKIGKSPIELFDGIGSHTQEIKEKYLLNKNDYVKLVGVLK